MFISQGEVQQWFSEDSLNRLITPHASVEKIATDFIKRSGNRWRPWLTAGVFESLSGIRVASLTMKKSVIQAAIAVECFHKASMIHDDIEDDDKADALHRSVGLPQALNAGDFLIHEGYRLLLNCELNENRKLFLIDCACTSQQKLCIGQGEEMSTGRNDFATLKTSPLFWLAFLIGDIFSGETILTKNQFSIHLGKAYQAKDDLEDGLSNSNLESLEKNARLHASFYSSPALKLFLHHYLETMFGQSAAAAAASSADIAPTAASLAP